MPRPLSVALGLVRTCLPSLLLTVAMAGAHAQPRAKGAGLRVGLVQPLPIAVEEGARFGLFEAAHTASLLGGAAPMLLADTSARALIASGATVLIGGGGAPACDALAELAKNRGVLFVALECPRSRCMRLVFHVAETPPNARGEAGDMLWHPSLEAFGAAQLNERYLSRHGHAMTGAAWAGWIAVKIVTEASLRARATSATALAVSLASPAARFDGHKGTPLRFDEHHRLVQPRYRETRADDGTVGVLRVDAVESKDSKDSKDSPASSNTSSASSRGPACS